MTKCPEFQNGLEGGGLLHGQYLNVKITYGEDSNLNLTHALPSRWPLVSS